MQREQQSEQLGHGGCLAGARPPGHHAQTALQRTVGELVKETRGVVSKKTGDGRCPLLLRKGSRLSVRSEPCQQAKGKALFAPVVPFKKETVRRVQNKGTPRPGRPDHRQRAEFGALGSCGVLGKTHVPVGLRCPQTHNQFVQQRGG